MELQFESKPIRCMNRCVWDVQETEQTQEVRLPDDMPDIGSILCAWGQCVLRGKEWHADHIGVNGGVMAWVLYTPSDGSEPRMVEAWLPMQCKWYMNECKQEGAIRTGWMLKGVDGRMLSARKMMVRANAQVLAEALAPCEWEIFQSVPVPEDVQLLKKSFALQLPKEAGEKSFALDEDLAISGFEKLISMQLQPVVNEQSVVGGKAVFRGDARVHGVYRGLDGMIHSLDREIPFSQFSDLDRDYDKEATVQVMPAVSNLELEQTENGVHLRAGLVMQYVVSDREMVETVEDAYSPVRAVSYQKQAVLLPIEMNRQQEKLSYEVELPTHANQVADATVWPGHLSAHRAGGLTEMECCGTVQTLYYDDSGDLAAANRPYRVNWELPVKEDEIAFGFLRGYQQPQAQGMGAEGSLTGEMMMVASGERMMVTGLELGQQHRPDPGRPSLILRKAGQESLWEIAKITGSTVEAIQKANDLTADPQPGRMLMIPVV